MKKNLLLTIALLTVSVVTMAQSSTFKGWSVKMGANYSTIVSTSSYDLPLKNSYKAGFTAGVGLDWEYNDIWGASTEILFSTLGSTYKAGNYTLTENSSYISVPLMGNLIITDGLKFKTGIQVGWLLSADDKVEGVDNPQKVDVVNAYNSIDFSIPVGISYQFNFGLIVEARYSFGITNIIKKAPEFPDYKATNSYATIMLGYKF